MSASTLSPSLTLLVGRQVLDGAAPEALAEKHGISVTDVNQAWLDCRQRLSRQFADKERVEYRLLNDHELQARLMDAIRLLLDWREAALYAERLEESNQLENDGDRAGDEDATY